MAQSIALAESYQAALDAVYKEVALTGRIETASREVKFEGAATAKVRKMSGVGLGTYSRSTCFPACSCNQDHIYLFLLVIVK